MGFKPTSYILDAEMQVQVVVPPEMDRANGSAVDMGCTSPLVDSSGVMVCGGCSYLTDGVSPDIDTSTSDWASQLVTVRRNGGTLEINNPHVLLTFAFDTAVSLTGIEVNLFLCPDWNIGAPLMIVYLDQDYSIVYHNDLQFVLPDNSPQSSCDSLSTVTFTGGSFQTEPYHTVHILVDLKRHQSIEWVYVGEVRFIGVNGPLCLQPTPSSPTSSTTSSLLPFTTLPSSCKCSLQQTSLLDQ